MTDGAERTIRWRRGVGAWMVAIGVLLSFALTANGAPGCDRWTGATSQSWSAAGNWTGGVPSAHTAACISGNAHNPAVTVAGHAVAGTLSLGANAQLTIASRGSLTVSHAADVAGAFSFDSSSSSVTTPSLTIERTGSLSGVGAVHGSVENAGSVSVVDGGSGVPLRVTGLYHQLSSGSILFRDEGGSFTQLRAGTASLGGGLDMLILDALTPGTRYKLVSARTLKGKFTAVVPGYVVQYRSGVATAVVTSQIHLNRSTVAPGGKVNVSGASFGYGGTIALHLDSPTGPNLGSTRSTSVGDFESTVTIPAHTSPGPHVVVAVESPDGYAAKAKLTVS